eukprot:SAG11_NODE_28242_length_324_cov_0.422222_1_plen_63_part_10
MAREILGALGVEDVEAAAEANREMEEQRVALIAADRWRLEHEAARRCELEAAQRRDAERVAQR